MLGTYDAYAFLETEDKHELKDIIEELEKTLEIGKQRILREYKVVPIVNFTANSFHLSVTSVEC
ncbi:MAG: hypothetical protein ACLQPD_35460 [Desulfomonilaceae bacterium]